MKTFEETINVLLNPRQGKRKSTIQALEKLREEQVSFIDEICQNETIRTLARQSVDIIMLDYMVAHIPTAMATLYLEGLTLGVILGIKMEKSDIPEEETV